MSTAQIKIELSSQAKLEALDQYNRRAKEAEQRTTALRESMSRFGEMAKLGAVFGAAGLTVEALGHRLTEATSSATAMASEIARSAGRVSISAEAYQVLGNILKGAGGDAADLTAALAALRNNLGEALRNQDSSPAKTLREIGESAADLSQLRPEQMLERLSKAFARIEDPARRASVAQDLLGKGATSIAPVIDRLASDGYGALREEVERTAGVMSNDMARALDEVTNRTENAGNRMAVAMAPFQLRVAETKASIAELFAELASSKMSIGAGLFAGGGALAAGVGGAALAAGGLGSAEAWGMVAGMGLSKAMTALPTTWATVGTMIGVAIAAAFVGSAHIKAWEQGRIAGGELRDDINKAPLDRAATLRGQLQDARSPEMVARIQAEASRRARLTYQQAQDTNDPQLRNNLEEASRMYAGMVVRAREHGAEIVATNRALDAQKAKQAEAERVAAELAARDKEAYDWTQKQGVAIDAQTAAGRRKLQLAQLDADQRRIVLELERESVLERQKNFSGTDYERQKNDTETAAKLLAIDEELAAARKEIAAETDKAAKAREHEAEVAERAAEAEKRQALRKFEGGVDTNLRDMHAQDSRNQADFAMTQEEKRRLHRAALEAEQSQLDSAAGTMRSQGDAEGARRYADRSIDIAGQLAADRAGTPETAMEGLEAGLTKLQDRWGSLSQQISSSVQSIGDAITGSLAGGMERLLGTTSFWSQKLGEIGGPIMGAVTESISKMAAEFIANEIMVAGIRKMLGSRESAENKQKVTENATVAGFKSIAQLGPIWGPIAFVASAALIMKLAGGFFEGGFTGLGNPRDPAGIVHKGEFVVPHDVTSAVGPGVFAGIVEQVRNPKPTSIAPAVLAPEPVTMAGPNASAAAQDEPWVPPTRVIFVDSRDTDVLERLKANPGFRNYVVQVGRTTGGFIQA